ncbi:DUF4190 domain-containing protein [Tsukamurella sp. 1534]|uniref:DUF4190 domain-containing protein n=1 Tax=Tsukamurella sp. 1534 TaxID=1151061 RepID=UPI0006AD0340|nr:DUF4190 domain-containing protein [Tsukamurella sp. 1534]
MTSSDPQRPDQGDEDPTVIRPQADPSGSASPTPPGDADATRIAPTYGTGAEPPAAGYGQPDPYANPYGQPPSSTPEQPNPYAPPADPYAQQNPYAAPADPYAAPSDPYAAQQNPYQAGNPYAADPYAQQQNPQGGLPQYPAYPGQNAPGYGYPGYGQAPQSGTNGLAIAALICGIAAFPLSCTYVGGFVVAIAGVIMGIIAMKKVKETGQDGHGMALAGVILGSVYLALSLIAIIVLVILAANGEFDSTSTDYLLSLLR